MPMLPAVPSTTGPAGFQEAVLFGVFDNIGRGAVFDAAAGVLELGFSEDGARGFGGEGVEFYEGSVADCFLEKRWSKSERVKLLRP
jgi:hypothetical protein